AVQVDNPGGHHLAGDVEVDVPGGQARADPGHLGARQGDVSHSVQPGFRVYHPPAPQHYVKISHDTSILSCRPLPEGRHGMTAATWTMARWHACPDGHDDPKTGGPARAVVP